MDKHLKLEKPLVTIYSSNEPHSIKVANKAPSKTTRVDDIMIKTAKTGKVTTLVAVMSIFSEKRCKLRSANCGNEKPSCPKAERADFPEENTRRSRSLFQNMRKGQIPKKLAPKSKKLQLIALT